MKNKELWYGYLEAGTKSSPILISSILDTNNEKTVYIYNLNRDAIIEYQRQIVEPKIRELNTDEADLIKELVSGYKAAKKNFSGKTRKPMIEPPAPKQEKAVLAPIDEDPIDADEVVDVDDESFLFDDD